MADAFYGEIRAYTFDFPPQDWAYCDGQALKIMQYQALYSVIGSVFGGDNKTYFNIPDLRGRVAAGTGSAAVNMDNKTLNLGETMGQNAVLISEANMPSHTHQAVSVQTKTQITAGPSADSFVSIPRLNVTKVYDAWTPYANVSNKTTMSQSSVGYFGNSPALPHANVSPYLSLNFCICLSDGAYPVRP
jgi:microcystin-dependent protein